MIWLAGTAGRGPSECEAALMGILPVLQKECADKNLRCDLIEDERSKHGMKSFLLSVEGAGEEDFAKSWNGTIEWICKSKIRPGHKRKRWFVGVRMLSLTSTTIGTIEEKDLIWDSMKASGPGGQHVNTTDSAVRLTHKPSGIVVTAQEERSQYRNKSLALAKLYEKMSDIKDEQVAAQSKERWGDHNSLERGQAIRTFEGEKFKENS